MTTHDDAEHEFVLRAIQVLTERQQALADATETLADTVRALAEHPGQPAGVAERARAAQERLAALAAAYGP